MIKIYCDRCGSEMVEPNTKYSGRSGYVLSEIGKPISYHLCPNCGDRAKAKITIRSHVEDFLENFRHKEKENNKDGN